MKPCRACQADPLDICAYHESIAEERAHPTDRDDGMGDYEAGRAEDMFERGWGG